MACGLTHWAVTPLDLVKCRRQVDSKLYKGNVQAWRLISSQEVRGRSSYSTLECLVYLRS